MSRCPMVGGPSQCESLAGEEKGRSQHAATVVFLPSVAVFLFSVGVEGAWGLWRFEEEEESEESGGVFFVSFLYSLR
jgi:uncharacterized protein YgiB involved in biofilm formation